MIKIAIIQFPGLNCEHETKRIVDECGMEGILVRWNQPEVLGDYDGYVVPGGFSYEDRGRAGLISSLDPTLDALREQVQTGKPVLGICNGAQILLEAGIIPGRDNFDLTMSLARNKRIKDGEVLGTGYYNTWVYIKSILPEGTNAFNHGYGSLISKVPIAHGEGRFMTNNDKLVDNLFDNQQVAFQYCDKEGNVTDEFPHNPNGAAKCIAAIVNEHGNAMGIMPHPERGLEAPMPELFHSMKLYIEKGYKPFELPPRTDVINHVPTDNMPDYNLPTNSFAFLVSLKITDNAAVSIQNALKHMGYEVQVERQTFYQIDFNSSNINAENLSQKILDSGELINLNKEAPTATMPINNAFPEPHPGSSVENTHRFLVFDKEDFVGQSKTAFLQHHLSKDEISNVRYGTLWTVSPSRDLDLNAILNTYILHNPHAQEIYKF